MYDFEGLTWEDIYKDWDFNKPDDTIVNQNLSIDTSNIDPDFLITKGRWKFYIKNPNTFDTNSFDRFASVIPVTNNDGTITEKRYVIESMKYNVSQNSLVVQINIIDNPIPLILVYAAIGAIILAAGAISINSILTHVEKIIDAPIIWPIALIILFPMVLPLFSKSK